jgi:hypothetical protein
VVAISISVLTLLPWTIALVSQRSRATGQPM